MSKRKKISFANFLSRFPEVDLPVTLGEETEREFYTRHDPIPVPMVDEFLPVFFPIHIVDEFTEFVPCFRIKDTKGFYAIVIWVAGLKFRNYFLITLNEKGEELQCRSIGGLSFSGDKIKRTVTRIEEDWVIYLASSESDETDDLDAKSETISGQIELLPDGSIVDGN
jgi:hypothetical protein